MALAVYQPKPIGYLFAAYRTIPVRVRLDYPTFGTIPPIPQIVFCDIYFNGVYYKTLSSTSYDIVKISGGLFGQSRPVWTFDVADAAQEYLRSLPPQLTSTTIQRDQSAVAEFFVAFRGSSVDGNGFTQPDGPIPVQGNFTTAPISGGGLLSYGYQVLNSTLQHEDVQDLALHLSTYNIYQTGYKAYPVSHRPGKAYTNGPDQYDHFPIVIPFGGLGNTSPQEGGMTLFGKYKNNTSFQAVLTNGYIYLYEGAMYYVPTGIPQLSSPTLTWSVPIVWGNVATYQIGLYVGNVLGTMWESPVMTQKKGCTGGARIHFLNALGGYDSVNFSERIETQNTKSDSWQKSLPVLGFQKADAGRLRFGVRSNKEVTVRTNAYPETAQAWLEELARSPRAYIETEGTQGQPPALIPVRIADGKVVSRKAEERYEYLLELTYEMSNEKIVQRG